MGNKKRILAWILSLAMVFGLFAGQVSVAKAAGDNLSVYKAEVSPAELTSKCGTVKITLTFDEFSAEEGTLYYRLVKNGNTVTGKENATESLSKSNNSFTIDVPENKGSKPEEYKVWLSGQEIPSWQMFWGGKMATFTVAAATGTTEPEIPEPTKVLPDKSHFRARAVDQSGNPVAGVEFNVRRNYGTSGAATVTSTEKGVVEYKIGEYDIQDTRIVSLAENDKWECDTMYTYTTNYQSPEIEKINNQNLNEIKDELLFVLKEKGAAEKADKVALKAAIDEATAIDTNKYSAGVEELKSALAEANTVYANEKATQTEVDAQVKSLKAAISALVEKEPQPEPKPEPQPEVKKVGTVALKTTVYTYNGKVKKPAVVAKNDKKKVISASDYTVKYAAGRKNVGKYSVTVTFKNGYKGKYTKTFTILPKGTKMSSVKAAKKAFTAKWTKQSVQTTGYQVQYSTSKNFKKSVKTATISKNKTVSKTVKKLSAKRTYYVRVRTYKTVKVNGKSVKLYSGWSKVKSVKTK